MLSREEGRTNDVFVASDAGKRPLLIMDSDTHNLVYTSMVLQRFEFKTHMAKTAQEAFDLATHTPPSLILTALDLNDMQGIQLLQMIKKHPNTAEIPLIAMRKKDDLIKEQSCLNAGAVNCLDKPVSAELLYRAVHKEIQKQPRSSMRIRTIQPVQVGTLSGGGSDAAHTLDLSERGMFLRTLKPAPESTRLAIRINLNGLIIAAEVVVVYNCLPNAGPYKESGMGLEFTRIAPKDQELIRRFIGSEVLRGILPENNATVS